MAKKQNNLTEQLDASYQHLCGIVAVLRACDRESERLGDSANDLDELLIVATRDAENARDEIETAQRMASNVARGAA